MLQVRDAQYRPGAFPRDEGGPATVALLAGYWALMNFVPIRAIQLESSNLAKMAEQSGDPKMAGMVLSQPSGS